MDRNEKITVAIVLIIVGIIAFVLLTPIGRSMWNTNMYAVQKTDDATSYKTLKRVEDTCRAMIASYTEDKLIYEQYRDMFPDRYRAVEHRDSDSKEQRSWSDQAKMRANGTATSYNEFVLKNSYVWKDNVPEDIKNELEYIK